MSIVSRAAFRFESSAAGMLAVCLIVRLDDLGRNLEGCRLHVSAVGEDALRSRAHTPLEASATLNELTLNDTSCFIRNDSIKHVPTRELERHRRSLRSDEAYLRDPPFDL